MAEKLLEIKNISKSFGPVKALKNVSFDLYPGEVHCLVGENGAGKSTLIKILAGLHSPDSGDIFVSGNKITVFNPNESERCGISVVHQELIQCADLTVSDNIFLGKESLKGVFLNKKEQVRKTQKLLENIDPTIKPTAIVNTLSTGKKQVVEIARAVAANAKIVIFDEPTSSLSEEETNKLYSIIDDLRRNSIGIIYISHRMNEIFRLADRVTVLRDGEAIGTLTGKEIEYETIVSMMVGRHLENFYVRENKPQDEVLFTVDHISGGIIPDASFYLKKGEILGFSGLIGAGRTELMRLIFGIDPKRNGTLKMNGREMKISSPADAIANGIVYVPEDRKLEGLFLDKSVNFNISICILNEIIQHLHVNRKLENEITDKYGKKMRLKMASYDQTVQALSGGNQQKVLISRWLSVASKVIILDEPTRGIDIGAKADIYKILDELAGEGYGIIFVSSELQEIIGMCDRVYVMRDHRIAGCLNKNELSQVSIIKYAVGGNEDVK